jgi:hypothetical protein
MTTQRILAILGLALVLLSLTWDGAREIWMRLAGFVLLGAAGLVPILNKLGLLSSRPADRKDPP